MRLSCMKTPSCAERIPRAADAIRIWRSNGLAWSTIQVYLLWVCRFLENTRRNSLMAEESLRKDFVRRWAARRAHRRGIDPTIAKRSANSALAVLPGRRQRRRDTLQRDGDRDLAARNRLYEHFAAAPAYGARAD